MKYRFIMAFLVISTMAFAQTPKTDFGKEFLPFWQAAKKQSMEMARLIPANKYSFVPAEGGRSIEKMFLHIAYAHHFMGRSFIGGEQIAYQPYENRTGLSKKEVMELMETAFNDITTALIAISEEELGDKVNAFGINPPRYRFLDF